jgi:Tfp pilus assembly PilM family ATPase
VILSGLTERLRHVGRGGRCSPIGLDVGTTRICAVQLTRLSVESPYFIVATATDRAAHAGERNTALDDEDLRRIRALLAHAPFRGRRVVFGLDAARFEFQPLSLPTRGQRLSPAEFRSALEFEFARQVNAELDGHEIRHWEVPPAVGAGPNVIGIACPQAAVQEILLRLSDAHLSCQRIDIGCLAQVRACIQASADEPPKINGVLDVGASGSRLTLTIGLTPVLYRTFETGGERLAQLVANRLGVERNSAEQLKREFGIVRDDAGADPPPPASTTGSAAGRLIFRAIRRELTGLCEEIERSFGYMIHLYPEPKVGVLHLIGGGARLAGLDAFLAAQIGIEVTCCRCWAPSLRSADRWSVRPCSTCPLTSFRDRGIASSSGGGTSRC